MTNAEQSYIYQLLEPESRIITGNAKRYKPVDWVKEYIKVHGMQAYQDRCAEDMEREKRQLKY